MKGIRTHLAGSCLLVLLIFSASFAFGESSHHGDGAPTDEGATQDSFQSLTSGNDAQSYSDAESPEVATNMEIARKALEEEAAKGNIPADAVPSILNSLVPVVQKFVSDAEEDGGPRDQRIKVILSPGTKSGSRDLLIEAAPAPGREASQIAQTVVPIPSAVVPVPDGALEGLKAYQSFDKLDTLVNKGGVALKTKPPVADRIARLPGGSDWLASYSPADAGNGSDPDLGLSTSPRVSRGYGMPSAQSAAVKLSPLPDEGPALGVDRGRIIASGAKGFSVLRKTDLPVDARVLAVPELPLDSALDAPVADVRFGWRVYLGTLFLLYGMGRLYFALRSRRNA